MSRIVESDAQDVGRRLEHLDVSGSTLILTGASGVIGLSLLTVLNEMIRRGKGPERLIAISKQNTPLTNYALEDTIEFCKLDLVKSGWKQSLPRADYVIHAAGYGQPARFLADPLTTLKLNTWTTMELLECLNSQGRFLFASSSEIYSGLNGSAPTELESGTTTPSHVRAPYIEAKRCGETICNASLGGSNRHINARIALAYGPGAQKNDQRVLYTFVRQALEQGVIRVKGTGTARRTYCYVSDTTEVLLRLLFNSSASGTYNVGGVSTTSIRNLAETIASIASVDVYFDEDDGAAAGAPSDVQLDLTRIRIELTKDSYVSLEEGVVRTLEWWKEAYE